MTRRARAVRAARLTILAAAALLLGGCGAGGVGDFGTGIGTGTGTGTGAGGQTSTALRGRWLRQHSFQSAEGDAIYSETIWEFLADGTARRTLHTTNLSAGLIETLVWRATWRSVGSEVEVSYTSPTTSIARFRWRVERFIDGDVLYLDDLVFVRL